MTESPHEPDTESHTLDPWRDERTTLTASGAGPATVLAAALTGLLAASRQSAPDPASADDATTALPLRAVAADLAELFLMLAATLLEDVDHEAYDVRSVRIDGVRRTDEGLRGWGYAFAVAGKSGRPLLTVADAVVTSEHDRVTIRSTLRR
jgi:hypothetical protein